MDLRAEYSGERVTCQANRNYSHSIVTFSSFRVLHAKYLINIKLDWSVCTCLTKLYLMVEICIEFTT